MANATLGMAADAFRAAAAEAPHPQPPLLPFMPDAHLVYVLPALMYWAIGLTFHAFDVFGLFAAYKLHTSAEVLRRNHATLAQVLGTAIAEQVGHALIGYYSAGAPALVYSHEYGIARWAQDIRAWRLGLAKLVPAGAATAAKVGAGVGFGMSFFLCWGLLGKGEKGAIRDEEVEEERKRKE
jgi:sphinganine C4-monooxygenase